jgi:hypothetical protein
MSPSWIPFRKPKIKFKRNDPSKDLSAIGETLQEVIDLGYTDGLRELQHVSEDASPSLPETVQILAQEYALVFRKYQSLQEQKGKVDEDLRRTRSSLRMAENKVTEGERIHSSKMDSKLSEFKSRLEDSRLEHEQALMHMETKHRERVNDLLDKAKQDEATLKHNHQQETARLNKIMGKAKENEATLKHNHHSKLSEFNSRLEDSRLEHEQALMHMETKHREQVNDLLDKAEQNEASLKHNHQQETARLNKIIHGRTKAIVTRETFTSITDRDLKTKLTELSSKVDSLAKLQWSPDRSTWRDDQLKQVRINSKKLQKSIIQETVWLVLHEYILCSPFRVFGTEGIKLEKQWNNAYGNGQYANPRDGPVLTIMDRRI